MQTSFQTMLNLERTRARMKLEEGSRQQIQPPRKNFVARHLGIFIPACIGLLTVVISGVQIYIARIENERQWRVDAANFVVSNWDKVYSSDRNERTTVLSLVTAVFPGDISRMIQVQSDIGSATGILDAWIQRNPDVNRALLKTWLDFNGISVSLTLFLFSEEFAAERVNAAKDLAIPLQ